VEDLEYYVFIKYLEYFYKNGKLLFPMVNDSFLSSSSKYAVTPLYDGILLFPIKYITLLYKSIQEVNELGLSSEFVVEKNEKY